MPAVGGSIESVTIDGRNFAVAADAEGQRKRGGFENEFQANGNGTGRKIMTRVGWAMGGLTISVDDARDDEKYLQGIQDRPDFVPIAFSYASGVVDQGIGTITGESATSTMSTTRAVEFMGPGNLTSQ